MSNVFKLPNGGCMYSHEEISVACKVYRKICSDRERAESEASDYAEVKWKEFPWYKRAWYQTKSGIFHPDEWWIAYEEKYRELMIAWEGCYISVYHPYITQGMAAEELCSMGQSGRNCYLNPTQIEVLEDLTKMRERL